MTSRLLCYQNQGILRCMDIYIYWIWRKSHDLFCVNHKFSWWFNGSWQINHMGDPTLQASGDKLQVFSCKYQTHWNFIMLCRIYRLCAAERRRVHRNVRITVSLLWKILSQERQTLWVSLMKNWRQLPYIKE